MFSRSFQRDPNSTLTAGLSGLFYKTLGLDYAKTWLARVLTVGIASPAAISNVLQGWPDERSTWKIAGDFGSEVTTAYWKNRQPHFVNGSRSDLIRSLIMMVRYGRAIQAIQSSMNRLGEVPSKLILRLLDALIPQINAKQAMPDTMMSFYVEKMLEALDKRSDVAVEAIATWEYQFFPLLEYGNRHFRIYELLANEPGAYFSLIRKVFRSKSEEEVEPDERMVADARIGYSVLHHFALLPGQSPGGTDRSALNNWIDEVRRLGREADLLQVTDSYVGRVLAHAKSGEDGIWPPEPVREQIERLNSSDIERAIQMERFNMRGAHFTAPFEGGTEERNFAKANHEAAAALARWPRTAALLRSIGNMWDAQAAREDVEAAQRRLKN